MEIHIAIRNLSCFATGAPSPARAAGTGVPPLLVSFDPLNDGSSRSVIARARRIANARRQWPRVGSRPRGAADGDARARQETIP